MVLDRMSKGMHDRFYSLRESCAHIEWGAWAECWSTSRLQTFQIFAL
uniref:Uncharacterized protein n=1 Tax=Anguilla anguilla TaxID=7936 RepID=A0A0E9PPB7_ANGAN